MKTVKWWWVYSINSCWHSQICITGLLFLFCRISTTVITILTYYTEPVIACYENGDVSLLCLGNVLDEFCSNEAIVIRACKKIGANVFSKIFITKYKLIYQLSFVMIAVYANNNIKATASNY